VRLGMVGMETAARPTPLFNDEGFGGPWWI